MTRTQQLMTYLIRVAIGNDNPINLGHVDWDDLLAISTNQNVISIVCDGLQKLHDAGCLKIRISKRMLMAMMQQESEYAMQENAMFNLSAFYAKYGIRMMVLKGWELSQNYPIPKHRHCSDIDIYLFGDYRKGDSLLAEKLGIHADNSHHHHTIFSFEGVSVENHYDFVNIHAHRSARKVDALLKEIAQRNYRKNDIHIPSAEFNAIFVLYHAAIHFAATEISLRNVLDWGLFVERHYEEVDWDRHWKFCEAMNMHKFLLAMNDICVKHFGFPSEHFKTGGNSELTERVFHEILQPEFSIKNGHGIFPYIKSRFIKWRANSWKHKIVYPESLTETFFQQVWAHLLKPATLRNKR